MAIDSLYTVTSSEQLKEYERIARDLQENLSSYLTFLKTSFLVYVIFLRLLYGRLRTQLVTILERLHYQLILMMNVL